MSVIDDLDNTESAARGRLALRQVAELYISRQPAKNTRQISSQPAMRKRAVRKPVLTTKTRVALFQPLSMEQSDLMSVVRGPLSPDAKIEVPASWDEYELAQELLDAEGNKYPRLWYDSTRQIAIVVAAPTPLHGTMVGELVGSLANSCNEILRRGGISEDIRRRVTQTTDVTKHRRVGRGLTIREWDGALRYLDKDDEEMKLMVAFEVGVSQSYRSLQEAITWSVCSLHCCLGIAMCLNEGPRGAMPDVQYYENEGEATAAIQQATEELRLELRQNPFGPLVRNGVTWFGALEKVVIETFRCEDANCPPGTMLAPTRSFVSYELGTEVPQLTYNMQVVIMDGQSSAEDIPPNLGEVGLGDCVPSHVLSDHEIRATPIDFFQKSWVEAKIRSAILETAVERIENKCLSLESTGR
ncbi:hypothetical protein V1525DRAFT_220791 [Lipomyces kononenkoae]|uniref:Uncharacterized protein n=1 Tax=Lipomyces kononenkoae TaxID=34357 RepID=A0ACC3SYJ1_LIPKO